MFLNKYFGIFFPDGYFPPHDGTGGIGGRPIYVTWHTTTLAIPWKTRTTPATWQAPTITAIPYSEGEL